MEAPDSTKRHEREGPPSTRGGQLEVKARSPQQIATESFTLEPWYPIIGGRGGRYMNRATAILREIKVKYQPAFKGIAEELTYEAAIDEYCERIKQEFSHLRKKNREYLLETVVVDRSDEIADQSTGVSTSEGHGRPAIDHIF